MFGRSGGLRTVRSGVARTYDGGVEKGPRDLRIGDPERENAMRLLGQHFTDGRLDVHEYDERCQRAAAARYSSEIDVLFEDLPSPRPNDRPSVPARQVARLPSGKIVAAVCAVALFLFLAVVARQIGVAVLLPLFAVFWLTWRR
jgi:hypothetical protein